METIKGEHNIPGLAIVEENFFHSKPKEEGRDITYYDNNWDFWLSKPGQSQFT